ncbi:MAG: thioesterase family protein [Clostridia bacterium]|nr:thioesterase family protein [Clostridia bacterium]
MKTSESRLRVRYKETDQMGIAHHSNYYQWFEVGRTDLIRDLGMSYRDLEAKGLMLPVLETHCYYKHGALYDDLLLIKSRLAGFNGVRLRVEYQVIREEDGLLLARGSTVHAFTDSSLKPINIKKHNPEIYKLFTE